MYIIDNVYTLHEFKCLKLQPFIKINCVYFYENEKDSLDNKTI